MTPDEIRHLSDPLARVQAATQAIADSRSELVAIRRDAVRQLRHDHSLADIAAMLGVTRSRVQAMER